MQWYKRWMGNYAKDTTRLSITEHGAYCLMLDEFYASEEPLPADKDELYIMLRAIKKIDQQAIDKVLTKYWTLTDDGYVNNKALDVMLNAQEYSAAQSARAKKKWDKYYASAENKDANADASASKNASPTSAKFMPDRKTERQRTEDSTRVQKDITNGKDKTLVTQDVTFRVFEHWRILYEHPQAKLSDKRKGLIKRALKMGYSEE